MALDYTDTQTLKTAKRKSKGLISPPIGPKPPRVFSIGARKGRPPGVGKRTSKLAPPRSAY